jgi:outer membrane protein
MPLLVATHFSTALRWTGALGVLLALTLAPSVANAQQRIAYIDSEYILNQTPEYATIQQRIDRLEEQWRSELQQRRDTVQKLYREFEARELLYTEEERQQKQREIGQAEQELENLRQRYFGPSGELYQRQRELMRPLQERILAAVEEVATSEGFDYVFDKSGDFLFMYAREQYNLSNDVLLELGIDTGGEGQP